jgi:autotransporter-associated beta strand protein
MTVISPFSKIFHNRMNTIKISKIIFSVLFVFSTMVNAQTLAIVNSGNTGTSGTNWSITGNTLTVTGTANIRASVIVNALANGNLTIVGNSTNFAVTISEAITATGNNVLAVGSATNTGTITFNAVTSFAGPVTVNGGNITVSQNISCTGSGSGLTLRATGFIYINGKTLQTNSGNIILWSDKDNSQLVAGATSDEIRLSSATTLNSQGGKIVLAGGLDDGANGGTASDGIPDNYAYRGTGAYVGGVNLGPAEGVGTVVSLLSGGGDILIRGQSASGTTNPRAGVVSQTKLAINSGAGRINVLGISSVAYSGTDLGGFVALNTTIEVNIAISSDYPGSGPAIRMAGARVIAGVGVSEGLGFGRSNYVTTSKLLIQSTSSTGGGILLEGANSAPSASVVLLPYGSSQLLSGTGDIIITTAPVGPVTTALGDVQPYSLVQQFGSRANTTPILGITPAVTSSNANIICRGNNVYFINSGSVNFATTGSCTFLPHDGVNSFSSLLRTSIMDFSTVSSLTMGKPTNISNVWIDNLVNVAGPITIYGGSITLGASLSSSTGDDIIIYSNEAASVATSQTITTSGTFKFMPQAASFSAAITYPFTNLTVANITRFDLGKTGNTANITIGTATSVNGPINIYGGVLRFNANLTTTNTTTGNISLYGTSFNDLVTGGIEVANGRTASINVSSPSNFAGVISGIGSQFIKDGLGTLILNNSQTYTGSTIINGGDLQVGSNSSDIPVNTLVGSINSSSEVIVASGSNLILSPQQEMVFTVPISGNGGLEIKGISGFAFKANPTFLTGTWVDIANTATVLEVLTRITGGNIIGNTTTNRTAGAYIKSYDAATNTATLQVQAYNSSGNVTSVIFLRLRQSGNNVQVSVDTNPYTTGAATRTGNYLNTNMTTGATQRTLSTLSTNGNLGLRHLYMSGKITITSELSYAGNTTISNTTSSFLNFYSFTSKGALEIIDASTIFPTLSNIVNNGLMIYNRTTPLTISSDMEGTVDVLQVGAAITLTGTNTHSGNTTIDLNKSLNIGSGGTIGSITGNIINYGTLTFNRSDSSSYAGIVSGSGALVKSGTNDFTLTGLNTYTGSSTINDGKLILERNVPGTSSSGYAGLGTLVIQPSSDTFSSAVSYPIAGFDVSNSIGGITIGKPSNTADITFANAITIAGPITAYGGTITLDANLTTTNNGNVSLYTDNALGLSASRTINAAGAFKYIPRTTTFSADVTYPIANLTATSTGLTIGKTTNDKNITITQDVTGGAGIELYGANVNINSNLKTTNSGAMYLKGNATIAAEKYIESNGAFTHDGNLTFKSTATGTAAFGPLGGTFTTVSGTATVERYIPAKRAYRFLSSSVTTATSIRQNWQENGGTTAGLGTHITGLNGITNGFDITETNNPSLYTINHTSGAWTAVSNTNVNTLTAGTAYRLMVRGDRTISLATNAPTATVTTLRATGVLKTGSHSPTLNQATDGYSFVGNPYQAPVDIKAVLATSTNMNTGVVYYWDPTLNTRGAYVTRTLSSVSTNAPSSNFTEILQPGQAVFVKNAATGTPSMTFNESNKSITSGAAGVFRATNTTSDYGLLRVNLKANVNTQWTTIEGALAVFSPTYSWEVTQEDANKFSNLDEEVSFMLNNTSLAIACQSDPSPTNELPMKLNNTRYTNYQWQFELGNYSGPTPYLFDTQNNTYSPIENNTIVPFTVNGQELTRFKIVFQNGTLSTPDFSNQIVLYPNPGKADSSFYLTGINNAKVSLYNLLGQNIPVETTVDGATTKVKPSVGLSQGVYVVNIIQEGKTAQVKWIVE